MAGVTRREFLNTAGSASAALAFMAANGIKLNANPLWPADWQPDVAASRAHRHRWLHRPGGRPEGPEVDRRGDRRNDLTERRVQGADRRQAGPKILDDHGLKSPSAHFRGVRTAGNLPTLIEWGNAIGMTHMNMASMGGQVVNGVTTLETVKRTCDEYNKIGAITKKSGLQLMTHNEGFENSRLDDGRLTYLIV